MPSHPDTLLVSTRNPGKLQEIRALTEDLGITILSPADIAGAPNVAEDAPTLEGNAALKAQTLHALSGLPTLADDTGLEVEALGGAPGVHSARFAGPDADDAANRRHLLAQLENSDDRSAQFRTVLAYVTGKETRYFEGVSRGRIRTEGVGEGGFGYDQLFEPEGHDRTFAQMSLDQKNRISHRARALSAFRQFLSESSDDGRTGSARS